VAVFWSRVARAKAGVTPAKVRVAIAMHERWSERRTKTERKSELVKRNRPRVKKSNDILKKHIK
jgi:hypothetical protein